jgi:hypothetical protein
MAKVATYVLFTVDTHRRRRRRHRRRQHRRHRRTLIFYSIDREPDLLTDIHDKLDILVDAQEILNTCHHRVGFEYDEDTVSLVVDPTLSTSDISISDISDSSTGNASTFEYECYEVEDDTPLFNYHGPKIKIPKQESPVTICTIDTIGTMRSQRLS